jgi:hypothetical protein
LIPGAECIGDPPDLSGWVNQEDVEPDALSAPIRMLREDDLARCKQSGLLARGQRDGGLREGWPAFYLDDRQNAGFLGDYINFAGAGSNAAAQERPTVGDERPAGGIFGGYPAGMSVPACLASVEHRGRMRPTFLRFGKSAGRKDLQSIVWRPISECTGFGSWQRQGK